MTTQEQDHETRFLALLGVAFRQSYITETEQAVWYGVDSVPLFEICHEMTDRGRGKPISVQVVGTRTIFYRDRIETTETGPEDW